MKNADRPTIKCLKVVIPAKAEISSRHDETLPQDPGLRRDDRHFVYLIDSLVMIPSAPSA